MSSPNISKERLLIFVLFITTAAFLLGWLIGGLSLAFAIAAVNILVLWIARNIWFSDKGNYLIRMAVLGLISLVVVGSNSIWQPFLQAAFQSFFPKIPFPDFSVSALTYGFLLALASMVFYFTRDKTILGKNETPLDRHIKIPDLNDRIRMVCIALADDIRDIDRKTNWSAQYYTPLEAEVEMQTKNGRKKLVTDLLKAIKNTDDRLILLLGEPGSGKSVSLRKLCLELSDEREVLKSQKIPVYINLKEWRVDREWSEEHPPTVDELEQFVFQNLKSRDRVTSDFFDEHFSALYENGNLFFAFDSFDEIPAVLGTSHNSELINQLSIVFRKFLKGARQPKAQGILSSREFRKPTDAFGAKTNLLVRPFTTDKIVKTLERSGKISQETIRQLFKKRLDLVPLARNPFTAALLSEFITQNNIFPKNQSELYKSYLFRTLKTSCRDKLLKKQITAEEVFSVSGKIGEFIFDKYGLEAPIDELRVHLNNERLDDVIEILEFARIGRKSTGDANMFSESVQKTVSGENKPYFSPKLHSIDEVKKARRF